MLSVRLRFLSILMLVTLLLMPATVAVADGHLPPIPQIGPRLNPPAIPHTDVLNTDTIYNNLLNPPPVESREADAADGGRSQEKPGRGIRQTVTSAVTMTGSPSWTSVPRGVTPFAWRTRGSKAYTGGFFTASHAWWCWSSN